MSKPGNELDDPENYKVTFTDEDLGLFSFFEEEQLQQSHEDFTFIFKNKTIKIPIHLADLISPYV